MEKSPPGQRISKIGQRLFKRAFGIAIVLTILLTLFQVWLNYQDLIASVQNTFHQVKQVQVQGITTALWNYSMPELSKQAEGLTHFPFVNYAEVREKDKIVASAGIKNSQNILEETIPLVYENNGSLVEIGNLYIQADLARINQDIRSQIFRIFLFQALNVLVVLFFILLMIDLLVTRRLNTAAHYLQTFDISNLNNPLVVAKRNSFDEIDTLAAAFNSMRVNLSGAYHQVSESERKHTTLLSNLPGMAFRCQNNRARTMELVSAGCFELTGYLPEELTHHTVILFNDLIVPEDREDVWNGIRVGLAEKNIYELNYRIQSRDGQIKWVWERGSGIYDEQGKDVRIEGFIIDITERKQQEREIEVIAAMSYALRTATTQTEMLPVILDQTMMLLNADGGSLELIDPFQGDAVVVLAEGEFKSLLGLRIPEDQGLNLYIRKTRKPYLNNHLENETQKFFRGKTEHCRATGGVPLIAHEQLIGFLWIGRRVDISENAIRSLSAIADIAASAIHRANLFQQTEQRLNRLIGLRKIDTSINSNQDLSVTLNLLLEQTVLLLQVDAANIYLLNENMRVSCIAEQGFQTRVFHEEDQWLEDSCAGKAILDRTMVKAHNLDEFGSDPVCCDRMQTEGFEAYFSVPLIAKDDVKGALQVYLRSPFNPDADWLEFLEILGGQAAIAVSDAYLLQSLQQSNRELQQAYDHTIEGWSNALDLRDKETEGHSQRVTELTLALARMLHIPEDELVNIRRGALLHDIGKMGVPDNILLKPGKLTEEEWILMRKHPVYAYQLLSPIKYLHPALDIPYCHHEKWDGTGYPRRLKGDDIPLAARIFAVADVWDALTSDRPYRSPVPAEEVHRYINEQSGKHFDPRIVELFNQFSIDELKTVFLSVREPPTEGRNS